MNPLELAQRALEATREQAEAVVQTERSGLARFAGSEVHQPTLVEDVVVQLRVVHDDGRAGIASTNRVGDDGLAELARRAEEAAAAAVPDEELAGLAPPADPPAVAGYDEETAELPPEEQARAAAAAIDAASLEVYGFFTSGLSELAVATSTGVAVSQRMTDATVTVLAADEAASGWASQTAWSAREIDPAAAAREAVAKAERTRDGVELEPGRYRAVLEPYAIAELLLYFAYHSFNGLAFVEGRSYLTGRIGERIFDPKVSVADDALDPSGLPKAFDFEGTPKQRVALVEDGVARGPVWDRETARKAGGGQQSTGHALVAAMRGWGPFPLALSVAPGEAESVEELAELVGDGIYVTRLHYLGIVQPREGVITGMTRDGTFRIRDGKIAEPLVNLRFTVSVPELLGDVPGLARATQLVNLSDFYDERYPYAARVPALATAAFNVTGSGSGPGL